MMLAWKSAACLAAGNTLVLKPAQVRYKRPENSLLCRKKKKKERNSFTDDLSWDKNGMGSHKMLLSFPDSSLPMWKWAGSLAASCCPRARSSLKPLQHYKQTCNKKRTCLSYTRQKLPEKREHMFTFEKSGGRVYKNSLCYFCLWKKCQKESKGNLS